MGYGVEDAGMVAVGNATENAPLVPVIVAGFVVDPMVTMTLSPAGGWDEPAEIVPEIVCVLCP
jgi:hypothetical protein